MRHSARPRRRKLPPLLCCPLLACLLLAACGGDDVDDEGAPEKKDKDAGAEFDPEDCRLNDSVIIVGGQEQGLEKYCEIAGNVDIVRQAGQPPITDADIEQLRNIHTIQGVLHISDTALQSLDGLRSLVFVAGDVIIDSNADLPNLYGLQKLKAIGGALAVMQHPMLTEFDALESLQSIGTGLKIEDNLALQRMDSLQFISEVSHSVSIRRNRKLKTLKGLTTLRDAGSEGLFIEGNHMLSNATGLESLERAGKQLVVRDNNNLLVLTQLKSLEHVVRLEISGNPQLSGVDGFGKLNLVDHVIIVDNDALKQVLGFAAVPFLATVDVKLNKKLTQLTAFANMKVATSVWLQDNQALSEVRFDHLDTVDSLVLVGNSALTKFSGFLPLKNIKTLKACSNSPMMSAAVINDFVKSRHPPKPTLASCD